MAPLLITGPPAVDVAPGSGCEEHPIMLEHLLDTAWEGIGGWGYEGHPGLVESLGNAGKDLCDQTIGAGVG
jgi:hypothetical protein